MVLKNNSRWWVLFSLSLGLMAVSLDTTVLNVALPTLAVELQASTSQLQWILDAYNLILAVLLLPAGMLGDRYGRKKLLLGALLLFGAASAACAASGTAGMLIGMRAFLGIGAAFLIPLSISVLPVLFKGEERTRAMMIWMTVNMLGIPLGPLVGGYLLKHYHWSSVFLINLPLIAIALTAVALLMPESHSEHRPKLDLGGIIFSSSGLGAITYGFIRAGEQGWSDGAAWLAIAGGILLLIVLFLWERKAAEPLVDFSLFRSRSFTWGTLLATGVTFSMFGLLFGLPQFFQAVKGTDAFGTGLRLLPLIGGTLAGAKISELFIPRLGGKAVISAGFVLLGAGLALGTGTGLDTGLGYIAMWTIIAGAGLGFALPTAMDMALGELTEAKSGIGSALVMATRQVGASISVALLGSALNAVYRTNLSLGGLPEGAAQTIRKSAAAGTAAAVKLNSPEILTMIRSAYIHGMELLLWICAGSALVCLLLGLLFLPRGLLAVTANTTGGNPASDSPPS